ncbi:helicase-exonuclease AddAB subunit AddA [Rossellomorea sp. BNER]|uniref:helicase-exonuclease AddAB subunit AddA n=1 Tax=Rossellomorea sp. BNER TaxID=2962031 RepID=UPI003AF21846|nr:helicase-exonuclease AddAB subunit AddA [Rossellomorea sp. BNER]
MTDSMIPVKPDDVTWTDDQWKAIWAKGQDILVAAAAGSGKTAVLVERIIQKIITDHDPIDVDELLVATFTNASAAEMRHRIGTALEKAIDQNPHSVHLRKQLSLLNKASISTLHSFCLEVIRKYYYLIDIDPNFRILDQTEGELLRDEVLDELFEDEYGREGNEQFYRAVDTFTNDRSDVALQDMIRKLYDFSRSNPIPFKWLEDLVEMYDVDVKHSIDDLPFITALKFDIKLQLQGAYGLFQRAYEITKIPGGPAPRAENFLDDMEMLTTLLKAQDQSWEELYERFSNLTFTRLKSCKGDEYLPELIEEAKKLREKGKKMIEKLKEDFFSRKPDSYLRDMSQMKSTISTLVELVKEFSLRFETVKNERGVVDFADLEHYCLAILTDPDSSGERKPSKAAEQYLRQFKEVLVDEYQDTNMVQESILKLVTKDDEASGSMFMVGDVKQSIYRFRLAEPNLFLGKYNRFSPEEFAGTGLKIDLSQNFRSRNEVLEGTNFLFKQIMGVEVGEIEYDNQAELKLGALYPKEDSYPIEMTLINQTEEEMEATDQEDTDDEFSKADLEKSVIEARYMATKVKELIEERKQIFDPKTKTNRSIQYRDIVILLRSMPWAPEIMEEFKNQGIPIYANLSSGYFEATEVAIMLSLLKVIDNPYQDIPLVSVLRSPIVGLNEEALAQIKVHSKAPTFYEACKRFSKQKQEISAELKEVHERMREFLLNLQSWRTLARQGALAELIWQLYRDTRFYDFVGGMPGGKQRQANLRALYDRARQYEETSFRGLFRFLRFVDRMRERGEDLGTARALSEQEDVVRMMTIHSSKGLEFPVVFIAGLSRQFNLMDLNQSYLLDKEYGLATKYMDPERRISYPSLPQLAFKRKKRMETIAEEMRVFYVALTRAKEKLYLIGTVKDIDKSLKEWQSSLLNEDWLLGDYERAGAISYVDWIGPALIRHGDCTHLQEEKSLVADIPEEIISHPSCWKVNVHQKSEFVSDGPISAEIDDSWKKAIHEGKPVDEGSKEYDEVQERLSWKYPYLDSTKLRSKQSVSELKRMFEVRDEASSTEIVRKFQKPVFNRPRFLQASNTLSPAEIGTSMHAVMQHISLESKPSLEGVKELLVELQRKEILSQEQIEVIDIGKILAFFETDLGNRLLQAKQIQREVPFSMSLPVCEVDPSTHLTDESLLVQGVIDLVFIDDQGMVLLDYKTDGIYDRYKGGFEEAYPILKERYAAQVDLYTRALQQILKVNVNERYLFFFDGSHIIEC